VECLAEVEACPIWAAWVECLVAWEVEWGAWAGWEAEWVEEALSQPEILLEVDPKLKKSIDLYLIVVNYLI